jgi:thiamine-phosphate pyrophosphorylase
MTTMIEPPSLSGLYAVTPDLPDTSVLLRAVVAVLDGGCRLVQYRNKMANEALRHAQASALLSLCRQRGAALIVNDDFRLAARIGASGAHLGCGDGDLAAARRLLGDKAIIGASCYDDFELARKAAQNGASYVAFGAVYASPSKPNAPLAPREHIARARRELALPVCAIGGITLENAAPLVALGASLLAVISDLFQSDPARSTRRTAAYQSLFVQEYSHVPQPVPV